MPASATGRWELAYICERDSARRADAASQAVHATVVETPGAIYADPTVDVVGSFAIEDSRPESGASTSRTCSVVI